MSEQRSPFPNPNSIRRYTQLELKRRAINNEFTDVAIPSPVVMPFVRFTSTKVDPGPPKAYRFFHMGLHGADENIGGDANVFELSYGEDDVVGYAVDSNGRQVPILSTDSVATKNDPIAKGKHPIPGIINVSVRHMGANEPIRTSVQWVCYNTTQLEFLRQHFLMAGGYVIIEFGNYWSNREQPQLFDFNSDDALADLSKFVIEGRKFMSDELFERAQGNYNMVIGRVVDQSITFQSDGTIQCTTDFFSTGEAVFGLHSNKLIRNLSVEDSDKFSMTIGEFFSENGLLDLLLDDEILAPSVVTMKAKSEAEIKSTEGVEISDAQLEKFRSRYGSTFIPWWMFIRNIMEQLFGAVIAADVSGDAELFTTMNLHEPEVGNHHLLASTDPETLVIIKSFMLRGSQEQKTEEDGDTAVAFSKPLPNRDPENRREVTFISRDKSEEKGLLTNGVWINVGAIKESFESTSTFYQGFMALLTRMNNATENYWDLDLAFDEEIGEYKVYDRNCIFGAKSVPEAYVFNRGKDGVAQGELIDLSFQATFSKEAKTSILLSSRAQTLKEATEEMSIDGFNQPSVWSDVLRLPDLKDELGDNIHAIRTKASGANQRARLVSGEFAALNVNRSFAAAFSFARRKKRFRNERAPRLARFANALGAYIVAPTELIVRISEDGRLNSSTINNFVAPIPTEIDLSLTLVGINGLAFYDTFLVDKLPRIYRDHGVFLINEIRHDVSSTGWTTTIGGLYYFVTIAPTGQASDVVVSHNEEIPRQGDSELESLLPVRPFVSDDERNLDRIIRTEEVTRRG